MEQPAFTLDEAGQPLFEITFSFPDADPSEPPAKHSDRRVHLDRYGLPLPQDLTEAQIDVAHSCLQYGHFFGRQAFLRNSYLAKDLLARVLAAVISSDPRLRDETTAWSTQIFKRRLQRHDVCKMASFDEVHDWAAELAYRLTMAGWPVRIEEAGEVRP